MASMFILLQHNLRISFLQNARFLSFTSQYSKSFYDSLGLTPKATQTEIKVAYYELSKIYHPDKNEGSEEASLKFRDITEAYEVLGNVGLRKRYDRGILHRVGGEKTSSNVAEDADESHPKFHDVYRNRPTTVSGSPIYDFDEWAQAHYGAAFARRQTAKKEYAMHAQQHMSRMRQRGHEYSAFCLVIMFVAIFFGSFEWNGYDDVRTLKTSTTYNVFPKDGK